jgi:heme-degrading monooxygenase HmoA
MNYDMDSNLFTYMKQLRWHVAQINVAKMIGESISDPVMEKFVAQLDEVNALAESSPGFVWRLKDETNNATSLNPYGDQTIIINMSVWESLEHLKKFVYHGRHSEVLRSRRDWFVNFGKPFTTLWYVREGDTPSIEEGVMRLRSLQDKGPTQFAFDFKTTFTAPANFIV